MVKRLLEGNARHAKERAREIAATAEAQHPHSCFQFCADSRVPIHLVAGATVGEIFTGPSNAGNVINPRDPATRATFEYAIGQLGVKNVGVIGHSGCGAVKALDHIDELEPGLQAHLRTLLPTAAFVRKIVREAHVPADGHSIREMIAEANVFAQLANLRSLKVGGRTIGDLRSAGKLKVHGLFYDVRTGGLAAEPPLLTKYRLAERVRRHFE